MADEGKSARVSSKWRAAPLWLKAACIVGVPWFIALVIIGVPFLVKKGPGLPLIWLGLVGLVPWALLATRSDSQDRL